MKKPLLWACQGVVMCVLVLLTPTLWAQDCGFDLQSQVSDPTCTNPNGGSIVLNGTSKENLSYRWAGGERGAAIYNLEGGTYTVEVTGQEGCRQQYSYTLQAASTLRVSHQASSLTRRETQVELDVLGGEPQRILWQKLGDAAVLNSDMSSRQMTLKKGEYQVMLIDAQGCVSKYRFTLQE